MSDDLYIADKEFLGDPTPSWSCEACKYQLDCNKYMNENLNQSYDQCAITLMFFFLIK